VIEITFTKLIRNQKIVVGILTIFLTYFFVFHNLTRFPEPWFDEGSHLHVPKTLVKYGRYADYSSEGFRYYGPTIGVGPTVMLPIAGVFKVFGIGLLQARLVMALYLIAAVYVFFRLVENLVGRSMAFVATALLVSSRSVLLLNYGRQLLGEVPGLFFLTAGLLLWFSNWGNRTWKRLSVIGLLFGLAMITKYQYLLFLAPTIGISWLLDVFYFKSTSHRNFLVPGVVAALTFALWQVITIRYLGPATMMENFAMLRASAEGVAFAFNPDQVAKNAGELASRSVFLGTLFPVLIYGFVISVDRNSQSQRWSILFLLALTNLAWYVIASIGWTRYAFLGLAISCIFVARFFHDLTDGYTAGFAKRIAQTDSTGTGAVATHLVLLIWLLMIILLPLGKTVLAIATPNPNSAREMAEYLDASVPKTVVIETWEPEMGFFTDHQYHYPPSHLLTVAIAQVYSRGERVQDRYDYVQVNRPEYLLIGGF